MKRVVDRCSRQEEKKKKMTVSIPIYTTENGTEIYVTKGTKLITSGYHIVNLESVEKLQNIFIKARRPYLINNIKGETCYVFPS